MTTSASFDTSAYIFECCCGERFNNVGAASVCKKCRSYSVWGYTKYVVNTLTEEVVHGEMPTDEEYAAQVARMEPIWEEERQQLQFEMQMWRQEGELYEAEMQRQREAAARRQAEEEEDILWEEQERLSR